MPVFKFICIIKTIYRTLKNAYWFIPGDDWVGGCDYIEQDDGSLKCKRCGDISK